MPSTNLEKLKLALQTGNFDIQFCPIFYTPRTPLDLPVVKNIDEQGIKCSGTFFTPDRVKLYERCGNCPAYSPDLKSRPLKIEDNNLRFGE